MTFQLALVGFLILLNAAFAGAEMALVSLRDGQLQRLEHQSGRGATLARLARDPNRFLATIQVGITLAGFLASASAAVSLAEPVAQRLTFAGGAADALAIVGVTIVLAFLTLVLGELAPKRLAMQHPEGWGLALARPLSVLAAIARPVVWVLSHATDLVVGVLGGDPSQAREEVTEDELREMVAAQPTFTPQQRSIIDGAFEVSERRLREVLRPRLSIFAVEADDPCNVACEALAASGHSRAPVCPQGNLDATVGIVHLRDLLGQGERPVREVASPVHVVPESAGVLPTLRDMQANHRQMVLVVNEHGGAEGIVTVEDLIEELVGEIYDETDRDVLTVDRRPDGSLVIPGTFPIHDLVDVGIDLPTGDYTTLAGFVLAELQRIPEAPGDTVTRGPWHFTVTEIDNLAITEVQASRHDPTDD